MNHNEGVTTGLSFVMLLIGVSEPTYKTGMFVFGVIGCIWIVFQMVVKIIELTEKYKKPKS